MEWTDVTAAQIGTLGVVVAILTGIIGVFYMARQSSRESAHLRQQDIDRAVSAATEPLKAELVERTNDRNYWRGRADSYEAELRRRE